MEIEVGKEKVSKENTIVIPAGDIHRISNISKPPLRFIHSF